MPPACMFQDGQRLGEFEILGRIGQGGMGAVYKARQVSLDRFVALKTLQGSLASDAEFIARFRREAKAAAVLSHSNLVQVYAAGETNGLHWFAMEFVEGESAQARVKRKERLDPAEALAIGIHVATALEYGWRKAQLIHRDIKPDNIFLSSDGEVKLGDLGLAKSAGETMSLTMTGAAMGTPHYVSPEQGEGKKDVDLRADIYSLGCTLFHVVSGETPFKGDTALGVMMQHVTAPVPTLTSVWPACPAELSRVVMKMMLKQPAARQQTYAEVLADLRGAYDALTGETLPQFVAVTKPAARAADIHSAPTIIISLGAASASGSPRTKSKAPLWIGLAVLGAVLAVALFLAFGKKEPQLTEAERAAKVLRAAAAPDPSALPAADGKERGENLIAASPTPATATKDAPFENSLRMKFVPVPITGGPTNGQRVLFSIWDTRVQDYQIFAKETKLDWAKPLFAQGPTHPAVNVSWEDAQAFCKWLTDRERRAGLLGARERYRLPSDHEWSCAAGIGDREDAALLPEEKKGGLDGVFAWGDQWPPPDKAANIASEELRPILEAEKIVVADGLIHGVIQNYHDGYAFTSPVESFAPNSLGLYDMGGNVQQWCEDWNDKNQKRRALRGASFATQERPFLLLSNRPFGAPASRYHWRGFRVVLESLPARPTAAVSPTPAPAGSAAATKFPPGQWVKVTELSPDLQKPERGKFDDGWFKPANPSVNNYYVTGLVGRNVGIRATARIPSGTSNMGTITLQLRGTTAAGSYQFMQDANGMTISHLAGKEQTRIASSRQVTAVNDMDVKMAFAAVGDRLLGWVNDKLVVTTQDSREANGFIGAVFRCWIRDVEVINLGGLSDAEALRILGVDEKGNDVQGKAGAAPAPAKP